MEFFTSHVKVSPLLASTMGPMVRGRVVHSSVGSCSTVELRIEDPVGPSAHHVMVGAGFPPQELQLSVTESPTDNSVPSVYPLKVTAPGGSENGGPVIIR